jgi:poly [ADP-ribose] polymerase 7/11/12/13
MTKRLGKELQEKTLFHGTEKTETIKHIMNQGFDLRLHGKTVYGKGCYFARDAKYSHDYTEADSEGIRRMFLVQVLVGAVCLGKTEYKRPPPVDPAVPYGLLYDTCVNDMNDPTIFVTFHNNHSYPSYLIEYAEKGQVWAFDSQSYWRTFCNEINLRTPIQSKSDAHKE